MCVLLFSCFVRFFLIELSVKQNNLSTSNAIASWLLSRRTAVLLGAARSLLDRLLRPPANAVSKARLSATQWGIEPCPGCTSRSHISRRNAVHHWQRRWLRLWLWLWSQSQKMCAPQNTICGYETSQFWTHSRWALLFEYINVLVSQFWVDYFDWLISFSTVNLNTSYYRLTQAFSHS